MWVHSIKIGVSRSKFVWYNPLRWVSVFIRLFTGKYNHAFFLINDKIIIEADSEGVNETLFNNKWKKGQEIRVYNLDFVFNISDMYQLLHAQIGKGYDFKGTLLDQLWFSIRKFFWRVFDGKKPRWTGHSKDFATKKFYCSELVGYIINQENKKLFVNWEQYNPNDIYKLAEETELLKLYFDGKAKHYK